MLGFDTAVSTDHDWGPRALLFLEEADYSRHAKSVRAHLPYAFLGWPTNFTEPDPRDHGTQLIQATTSGPINHRVEVHTLHGFGFNYFGLDLHARVGPNDWLTLPWNKRQRERSDRRRLFHGRSVWLGRRRRRRAAAAKRRPGYGALPSHKLRTINGGAVFHDDVGLDELRARLEWYPRDVWLWLLAAGWKRIAQGEHLMGRAGQAGDEIGSTLIAARLVNDTMRLCFLMERQFAPYAKWFGTAFASLEAASELTPLLWRALRAATWLQRDRAPSGSATCSRPVSRMYA